MAMRHDEFLSGGARLYGLSADSPAQNAAVMQKLALPFPILSDEGRVAAITPLGFADEKDPRQISRAGVVIIDTDGEIVHRSVGRDYADRPDEDELIAALRRLELEPTTQDQPAVGLAVVSLLAVRVWAGTVGHHPSVIDLVAGLAIAAYVGGRPILWIPALAFGVGIVVAARHRVEASAAVATGVAIAVVFAMMSDATVEVDVSAAEITAIAALAAATALAVPIRSVASATDRRSLPISPGRVSAAWLVGLAVVIATAALGRLSDGAALIAAMSSAAPVHLSVKLGPRRGV